MTRNDDLPIQMRWCNNSSSFLDWSPPFLQQPSCWLLEWLRREGAAQLSHWSLYHRDRSELDVPACTSSKGCPNVLCSSKFFVVWCYMLICCIILFLSPDFLIFTPPFSPPPPLPLSSFFSSSYSNGRKNDKCSSSMVSVKSCILGPGTITMHTTY